MVSESNSVVSVPLRGLIMWKPIPYFLTFFTLSVSVPLRGLIMWKLYRRRVSPSLESFSPLTGINYVETGQYQLTPEGADWLGFSPLTGINYVETL